MNVEEQVTEFKRLQAQGKPILDIARQCVVTEPMVRKRLGLRNPDIGNCDEYQRRDKYDSVRQIISQEIEELYEPKFITPQHTSGFIEALITMSDARQILELGMYSGFTTLHMIRAIVGKPGAKVVSIDPRPAHDVDFFSRPSILPWFEFIQDWTPQCLTRLQGRMFDLVFVDSDHSLNHTAAELAALMPITKSGSIILFHDAPKSPGTIYNWLESKVSDGTLKGLILPTAPQPDVSDASMRPNLGVFMRP